MNMMGMPSRAKTFDECDADEKFRRLARELASVNGRLSVLSQECEELRCHAHAADGRALVPLGSRFNDPHMTYSMRLVRHNPLDSDY